MELAYILSLVFAFLIGTAALVVGIIAYVTKKDETTIKTNDAATLASLTVNDVAYPTNQGVKGDVMQMVSANNVSFQKLRSTDVTFNPFTVANTALSATTVQGAVAELDAEKLDSDLLASKGDLITRNSTEPVAIGAGSDNDLLTADSTATSGLKYQDVGTVFESHYLGSLGVQVIAADFTPTEAQWQAASVYPILLDTGAMGAGRSIFVGADTAAEVARLRTLFGITAAQNNTLVSFQLTKLQAGGALSLANSTGTSNNVIIEQAGINGSDTKVIAANASTPTSATGGTIKVMVYSTTADFADPQRIRFNVVQFAAP